MDLGNNEFLEMFLSEAEQYLEDIEQALLVLEEDSQNKEKVNELFRALHTLKGTANMMDFTPIAELAHRAEDVVGLIRDGEISIGTEEIDLFLKVLDILKEMVARVSRGEELQSAPKEIFDRLTELMQISSQPHEPCKTSSEEDISSDSLDSSKSFENLSEELFENFSPYEDPESLHAFFSLIKNELPKLSQYLLQAIEDNNWEPGKEKLELLSYAAEQMGFKKLKEIFEEGILLEELDPEAQRDWLLEFEKRVLKTIEEIREEAVKQGINLEEDLPVEIFKRQTMADAEAMLARLKEIAEMLHDVVELTASGELVEVPNEAAEEAVTALRGLYEFTILHQFEPAAEITLALEDIFARILQGELAPSRQMVGILERYVELMLSAFESVSKGEEPDFSNLSSLVEESREYLTSLADARIAAISKKVLEILDLSEGILEVMTPENYRTAAEILKEGGHFFEILADLDTNPEVAEAFLKLQDKLTFITNETVYQGERTLFNFLVGTKLEFDEVQKLLLEIDPDGKYFSLKRVKTKEELVEDLKENVELEFKEEIKSKEIKIEDVAREVEEAASAFSVFQYILNRFESIDLETLFGRLSDENGKILCEGIEILLRARRRLAAAFEKLQESIDILRTEALEDIFCRIEKAIRAVATAQNKELFINIKGGEVRLERTIITSIFVEIRRLVVFLVTEGIKRKGTLNIEAKAGAEAVEIRLSIEKLPEDIFDILEIVSQKLENFKIELFLDNNTIVMKIPYSRSFIDGMVTKIDDTYWVIPLGFIQRIVERKEDMIVRGAGNNGYATLNIDGKLIPIRENWKRIREGKFFVILEESGNTFALPVDEVLGQEGVMVKPLNGYLSKIQGARGVTVLGNGETALVLSV